MKALLNGRVRRRSYWANTAVCALAWLAMLGTVLLWFAQPANAAEITFDRAYTGTISGQTFTANGTLVADAGSIKFDDGGTSRVSVRGAGVISSPSAV